MCMIHPIHLNITQLTFAIVELWRSKILTGSIPFNYTFLMTRMCDNYKERTGEQCNTVGTIEPLENWYDSLTDNEKNVIRNGIKEITDNALNITAF